MSRPVQKYDMFNIIEQQTYWNTMGNKIKNAINKISLLSGRKIKLEGNSILLRPKQRVDALISIKTKNGELPFVIFSFPKITRQELPHIDELKKEFSWLILTTKSLTELMEKSLQRRNVGYMTEDDKFFLPDIEDITCSNKLKKTSRQKNIAKYRSSKAMNKIVFALLSFDDLNGVMQRQLSDASKVSLGSVNRCLKMLEGSGYIDIINNNFRITSKEDLTTRWVQDYAALMLPDMKATKYSTKDAALLKAARRGDLTLCEAWWGGEVAATILGGSILASQFLIYHQPGKPGTLIRDLKLIPDPDGEFELRDRFWSFKWKEEKIGVVPLLLVYADLSLAESSRDKEAAKEIYEKLFNA